MLRVMRPLRILSRNQGLKVSIGALVSAIPDIMNILMVALLFFIVYGILSVGQFKGAFYECTLQLEGPIETKWDCLSLGGVWLNFVFDFDNVFNSVLLLYTLANGEGLIDLIIKSGSARGIDLQPKRGYSPATGLFFILFMIWGHFLILNLFCGSVISTYNRQKETLGKVFLLSGK